MDAKRERLMKIRDEQQKAAAPAMVEFVRVVREQEQKLEAVRQVPQASSDVVFLSYR